jgi:glyoxylase-like metal-dependent hydrolase (beta-lactamase superfamily II)
MSLTTLNLNLHQISLGFVSTYLIESDDGLMLIDTGIGGSEIKILAAMQALGKQPGELRHIILTHLHGDHTGGLAALKQATGAAIYAHALEAPAIHAGQTMRPIQPGPGLMSKLMVRSMMKAPRPNLPGVSVEHELQDGDSLPGGWQVIHTPGHTGGHISLKRDDILILGDAATRWLRLGGPPLFEDYAEAQRSLQKLARLDFEMACFSHGKPILNGAAIKFRHQWDAVV